MDDITKETMFHNFLVGASFAFCAAIGLIVIVALPVYLSILIFGPPGVLALIPMVAAFVVGGVAATTNNKKLNWFFMPDKKQ